MILLGKRKEDDRITAILANTILCSTKLDSLLQLHRESNALLKEVIAAVDKQRESYGDFINVIQNFFAVQKRLSIEETKRRLEKDAEFDMTEHDKKY